ncbi:KH homology domain-containing protein 4-like [Liolophura sinensis]|uniref:KH homology domain-containing protein 4-like n=1 Tax=Liolophura sinensis TaxID=3198878 RepID=UPI0031585CD0
MAETIDRTRATKWEDPQNHLSKSSLEAAAEAAARVNAMLIAKGKLRPSRISQQQASRVKCGISVPANPMVAEVEINDVPIGCRNLLTRGSTQDEISKASGAAVSTRGRYMTAEDRMRNTGERPLYLYVQGPTQDSVDLAVKRINDIITNGMKPRNTRFSPAIPPPGVPGPRPPMLNQPPPLMSINAQPTGLAYVQEKLFIGLEHAPPNFDVKNKLLGHGGSYLQHIQSETGAKVTLRGKGSGFLEPTSGREAFEPMHIHLQHANMMGLQQAKHLAENLILTVQHEYSQFQQAIAAMPPTISAGTATLLAGIQHPTSVAPGMLPPQQPGMTTFTSLAQPNVQHLQDVHAGPGMLPNSSISTMVFSTTIPTVSSMAPPTFISPAPTNSDGGSQLLLSSIPAPMVTSGPGVNLSGPPPPGHVLMGQPQSMGIGPPVAQVSMSGPLVTQMTPPHGVTVPPGMQLVSQATLQPVQQQQPVQTFFAQIPPNSIGQPVSMSGPPVMTSVSTGGYTVSSSGHTYGAPVTGQEEPNQPQKRRFREEKEEDKVPENLLGYQHGPPHLTNLVTSGPPLPQPLQPGQTISLQLQGVPPQQVQGVPPQQVQLEERQSPVYLEHPPGQGMLMTPPPPPPGMNLDKPPDIDKQLMPPPPSRMHGNKRANGEPERKRVKGALGEVAVYGSDDEVDEEGGGNSPSQRDPSKGPHHMVQFSGSPPGGINPQTSFAQPIQQLPVQPQQAQFQHPPPHLEQFPGQLQPQQSHPPPQLYIQQQIGQGPPQQPFPQPPQPLQPQFQQFHMAPPTSQHPTHFQQLSPTHSTGQFVQRGIPEQHQFNPGQPLQQIQTQPPHPSHFNGHNQQIMQPFPGQPPPQQATPPPQFQTAPPSVPLWVPQN